MSTDATKEELKNTALSVSRAILNGQWDTLAGLLDDNFTYSGDGFTFTKDEYIGFMQDMKAAFSNLQMEFPHVLSTATRCRCASSRRR